MQVGVEHLVCRQVHLSRNKLRIRGEMRAVTTVRRPNSINLPPSNKPPKCLMMPSAVEMNVVLAAGGKQ